MTCGQTPVKKPSANAGVKNSQKRANNNNNNNYNNDKLKLDHTSKWYMRKPESVLKNKTQKNREIQTDHQIAARKPELMIINNNKKVNLLSSGLCRLDGPQSENQK